MDWQAVKPRVEAARKILITGHHSPDGDAMGAMLAVYHWLKALGKEVYTMVPNPFSVDYHWMPGSTAVKVFEKDPQAHAALMGSCDLVFILDYNHLSRIKAMGDHLDRERQCMILIDHHRQPDVFDVNLSDIHASSTCELVYRMLQQTDPGAITPDIATCLYTGIMTDTGSFRYANTTADTHRAAADLIARGAENADIQNHIGNNGSEHRLRLLGYALYEKMVVLPECGTAYTVLTNEELRKFHYQPGDTEGLVNYGLSMQSVNLSVLLKQQDGLIKISFRSIGRFSVNDFARNYFKGGGHLNAAGGASHDSLDATVTRLKEAIQKHRDEIVNS